MDNVSLNAILGISAYALESESESLMGIAWPPSGPVLDRRFLLKKVSLEAVGQEE